MIRPEQDSIIDQGIQEGIQEGLNWGIAIGIFLILLGIVAITLPLLTTLATTLLFAGLLIAGGIAKLAYAFKTRGTGQFVWKLLFGILYILAGLTVFFNPISGALTLTLLTGVTVFLGGVFQVIVAFKLRPADFWGLALISGIAGIILGIFIWSGWPSSAVWTLGLLFGLNLIVNGLWIAGFSSALSSSFRGN